MSKDATYKDFREKVMEHKDWDNVLKNFHKGLASTGKKRKQFLNTSFDYQCIISHNLKVPLYEIGCLVRSKQIVKSIF